MLEQKIEKLIEEAAKVSGSELAKAAGRDFVYTSNPDETLLSLFHPIKADAVSADDLEHRAKVLDIDRDIIERNMAIRDADTSGYVVDNKKLAGYASRKYPDDVTFGNTVGTGKHIAINAVPGAIMGAGLAAMHGGDLDDMGIGAGVGTALGGTLGTLGNYIGFKQGQALHDRLNRK
jgi:hypothetical protein